MLKVGMVEECEVEHKKVLFPFHLVDHLDSYHHNLVDLDHSTKAFLLPKSIVGRLSPIVEFFDPRFILSPCPSCPNTLLPKIINTISLSKQRIKKNH